MKSAVIAVALGALLSIPVAEAAQNDVQRARAAVRRVLKDPEAARFSREFTSASGAVCGFVNMKNSYGGYGGDKRYLFVLATGESAVFERADDTSPAGRRAFQLAALCR
jgi:hypothetical protein